VGSVWRTVLGVLILGMITNGFNLLAVPDYWQNIVRGILIIAAVAISTLIERRLASRRRLDQSVVHQLSLSRANHFRPGLLAEEAPAGRDELACLSWPPRSGRVGVDLGRPG